MLENHGIKSQSTVKTNLNGQRISKISGKHASFLVLKIVYTLKNLK